MALVHVPEPLCRTESKCEPLRVTGSTVREVLNNLAREWPELGRAVWADGERLAAGVAVFVGTRPLRALGGLDAAVEEDDEIVLVLPLLVGG